MTERDVEECYRRRLELRGAAEHFMQSEAAWHNWWAFPAGTPTTTLMVIPCLLIPNRILFHEAATRKWLQDLRQIGDWFPSMYGVFTRRDHDDDHETVEMHRNGAVIAHHRSPGTMEEQRRGFRMAYGHEFYTWRRWLEVARQLHQYIAYDGPVTISVVVQHAGLQPFLTVPTPEPAPFILPCGDSPRRWPVLSEQRVRFVVECSAAELALHPERVLREAADSLFRAFGRWQADCFDEDDQLVSR